MFPVFPLSSRLKRSPEIWLKLFGTYWEQWEHWEQAPEMSDLRCSQLVSGDWEHWEQRLASRRDQAPDGLLLGGVLLAYFLALSAVELADGECPVRS